MPTLPAALLCDMDGTLVDTERAWLETVGGLLRDRGRASDADALRPFAGLPVPQAAALAAERTRQPVAELSAWLDQQFTEQVAEGVTIQPGARGLLDQAAELGVPIALVTASERTVADMVLRTLGPQRFALSVTNGETKRGKPHPDPYLAACRGLGVDSAACLAVEDTPAGATAALAAGCHVLAVPTVSGIAPGPRTTVVSSLSDVRLADFPFA